MSESAQADTMALESMATDRTVWHKGERVSCMCACARVYCSSNNGLLKRFTFLGLALEQASDKRPGFSCSWHMYQVLIPLAKSHAQAMHRPVHKAFAKHVVP